MQRTVKSTRYTYIHAEMRDGVPTAEIRTAEVPEHDSKKALRAAAKLGISPTAILSAESVETLYKLDDEIFFKYAVKVEGSK